MALDLDRCIIGGALEPWARRIIEELDSYTERSPSGCGVRIFVHAALSPKYGNRRGRFEVYDRSRYVTVTGDHFEGTSREIMPRQDELMRVLAWMLPPLARVGSSVAPVRCVDRSLLLEHARSAYNGERFRALYDRGELSAFQGDWSRADLALCAMLAFWCGGDAAEVDQLFRGSALFREKWDERHRRSGETYGQMTLAKALSRLRHHR